MIRKVYGRRRERGGVSDRGGVSEMSGEREEREVGKVSGVGEVSEVGSRFFHPRRSGELMFFEEFGVVEFGSIPSPAVAEYGDNGVSRPHDFGKGDGPCDIDSAGSAEAESFMKNEVMDGGEHGEIVDSEGVIDEGKGEIFGDSPLADSFCDGGAFGFEDSCFDVREDGGPMGVCKSDGDVWVV